ncbi:MAG: DoxX family membrane protein [Acidobacteriota bacterium]|nr:MAG: DoxX family membrane protein [Acidobacteriota bacterium]
MNLDEILKNLPALFAALFTAILFLQSGLDKVFDWKGNIEWLTGHFSKTFLGPFTTIMVLKITVLELLTGLTAAAGLVYFFIAGSTIVILYAAILGAATITGLFFGQRIAKDYAGAAVLAPYFLLMLTMMFFARPAS